MAIHGGPGLNFDYLDDAGAEVAGGYRVAPYQQRGLAPSTEQGEFTVAEAVADIVAVLGGVGDGLPDGSLLGRPPGVPCRGEHP